MKSEAYESVKGQMGPCGLSCAGCDLGNGKTAETAKKTKEYLQNYGVSEWAAFVSGGSEVDFDQLFKSLDWVSSSVRMGAVPPTARSGNAPTRKDTTYALNAQR